MKRVLLIVALMVASICARAQWFDFSNNVERLCIGFHGGKAGVGTYYSDLGFGFSASAYGIYLDFVRVSPAHQYDNHVTSTLYNDSSVFSINMGYQFPVLSWLRVAPILGYSQTNNGITDATTVNIETGEDSRIFHDYDVSHREHFFNFGVGLFIQPIRWIEIYGVASRRTIYGGISLNLGNLYESFGN